MELIDKDKVIATIRNIYNEDYKFLPSDLAESVRDFKDDLLMELDTLEVKEVDNMPNIRFPHYKSIAQKAFGAGNLESFEYDEAEQLVSLAKEELLKDLEVKDVDLEKEYNDFQDLTIARLVNRNAGLAIAKHFFELGLIVKQSKTWKDEEAQG